VKSNFSTTLPDKKLEANTSPYSNPAYLTTSYAKEASFEYSFLPACSFLMAAAQKSTIKD
jgi:hypothetical protein